MRKDGGEGETNKRKGETKQAHAYIDAHTPDKRNAEKKKWHERKVSGETTRKEAQSLYRKHSLPAESILGDYPRPSPCLPNSPPDSCTLHVSIDC